MTSHDEMPKGRAPDDPSQILITLYRDVEGAGTWMNVRVNSADPWVPNIAMKLESDRLRMEDHSHKGTAERILTLVRPALQAMCATLIEDATGEPIDL